MGATALGQWHLDKQNKKDEVEEEEEEEENHHHKIVSSRYAKIVQAPHRDMHPYIIIAT
jgi:hypothetical protein